MSDTLSSYRAVLEMDAGLEAFKCFVDRTDETAVDKARVLAKIYESALIRVEKTISSGLPIVWETIWSVKEEGKTA